MILVAFVYVANNCYMKASTTGIVNTFFVCYFNDLICPLFLMSYVNLLLLTVGKKLTSLVKIIVFMASAGVVWEFFAQIVKTSTTTDLYDLLCYIVGGLFYWIIIKCTGNNKKFVRRGE